MKIKAAEIKKIKTLSEDLGGVFTYNDLKIIFPTQYNNSFYGIIKNLESLGIIKRFIKGFYVTEDFNLKILSQKICRESYVSFETVLASSGLIGTFSDDFLRAVKIGRSKIYKLETRSIVHMGISKDMFFGYHADNGINYADKEKAFLDTLYFYTSGMTFYFDIYSDITTELLDIDLLNNYLKRYKNPKFIKFVKGYLNETT